QAERMDRGERRRDLHGDVDGVDGVEQLATIENIAQRPVEQGHDKIEIRPLFAKALDGDDVRMRQLAHQGRLVLEARDILWIGGEGGGENLDGDFTVGGDVPPMVDLGHATDVEQLQQQVVAQPAPSERSVFFRPNSYSVFSQGTRASHTNAPLSSLDYSACWSIESAPKRRYCRSRQSGCQETSLRHPGPNVALNPQELRFHQATSLRRRP